MIWTVQNIFMPGLNLNEAVQLTPFVDRPVAGNKITLDPLTITFILDEEIWNWWELASWMMAVGNMSSFKERRLLLEKQNTLYSDLILVINSNQNTPRVRVRFTDAWPTSLSQFNMTTTDSGETALTCDATFRYFYLEVERMGQPLS